MNPSIYEIPLANLAWALVLIFIVLLIYIRWSLRFQTILYAACRMLLQLTAIGFALVFIFESESKILICSILTVMLLIASWIAIRPVRKLYRDLYPKALLSLTIGCLSTLALIIFGVIRLTPWHEPRYLIPIAGMIFSHSMNSVSLAAERFHSERSKNVPYVEARSTAFQASLIPILNNFFAVGLVALPGMMTGQILAGISPLMAIRYQIMVMCMLLGGSGISAAIYLTLCGKHSEQ